MECRICLKKDQNKKLGDKYPLFLYVNLGTERTHIGITRLIKEPLKSHYSVDDFEKLESERYYKDIHREQVEFSNLQRNLEEMIIVNQLQTLTEIKTFIRNYGKELLKPVQEVYLGSKFDEIISEKKELGKSEGEYVTVKSHIDRFIINVKKRNGIDQYPLRLLNEEFIDQFKKFLKNDPINQTTVHKNKRNNLIVKFRSESTINSYLRQFRSVLRYSRVDCIKWFSKIDRQISKNEDYSLENHELKKLFEYQTNDEVKRWSVNLFLLTYFFQGTNLIDLIKLTTSNVFSVDPESSKDFFIEFTRSKTKDNVKVTTPITIYLDIDKIGDLLNYFHFNSIKEPKKKEKYLLKLNPPNVELKYHDYHNGNFDPSVLSNYWNKICGKYLKKVCDEIGIQKQLNLKITRKTSSTKTGIFEILGERVQTSLGHTSILTQKRFYRERVVRVLNSKNIFRGLWLSIQNKIVYQMD